MGISSVGSVVRVSLTACQHLSLVVAFSLRRDHGIWQPMRFLDAVTRCSGLFNEMLQYSATVRIVIGASRCGKVIHIESGLFSYPSTHPARGYVHTTKETKALYNTSIKTKGFAKTA